MRMKRRMRWGGGGGGRGGGGGDVASPPQWKKTSQWRRTLPVVTLKRFSPSIWFCQVGFVSQILALLLVEPIKLYGVGHRHTNKGTEMKFDTSLKSWQNGIYQIGTINENEKLTLRAEQDHAEFLKSAIMKSFECAKYSKYAHILNKQTQNGKNLPQSHVFVTIH